MYKTLINKEVCRKHTGFVPWSCERQADIMLNYLPLRNVLTYGIKAMLKNKALPDSALPIWSVCLSLSLSLTDLALSRLVSHVFSLSRRHRSSWGYPLDPAEAGPQQGWPTQSCACINSVIKNKMLCESYFHSVSISLLICFLQTLCAISVKVETH